MKFLIPEEQHERLEESPEVVVVRDGRVFIQRDVTKHLNTVRMACPLSNVQTL